MKKALLTILVVISTACACSAAIIEIKPDAGACGEYVTLREIAEFHNASDDLAGVLNGIFLGKSPEEGFTKTITLEDIKCELRKKGVVMEGIAFAGADKSLVSRMKRVMPANELAMNSFLAEKISSYVQKFVKTGREKEINVNVKTVYNKDMAGLEFNRITSVEITNHTGNLTGGTAVFFAEVTTADGAKLAGVIDARVAIMQMVAVAARPLRLGITISGLDVAFQKTEVEPDGNYYTSADDIIGGKTMVSVAQGVPLNSANAKSAPLVRRNDSVMVVSEGENFAVETVCVAMESGSMDEIITVQNKSSKKSFEARVAGRGRAVFAGK